LTPWYSSSQRVKCRSDLTLHFFSSGEEDLRRKRLFLREKGHVQLLDRRFVEHLSEMHPTSALHELCARLDWPQPNLSVAFECGPPMARLYIFKVR